MTIDFPDWAAALAYEGFTEMAPGIFVYQQDGATPWVVACPPDPEGQLDVGHLQQNIQKPTAYLDVQARLVDFLSGAAQ